MIVSTSTSADLDAMVVGVGKDIRITVYAAFSTTGATCVVAFPAAFRRFRVVGWCWAAASASDEILSVDSAVHTIDSLGVHTATASPPLYTAQFIRTGASKTSGLGFFVTLQAVP